MAEKTYVTLSDRVCSQFNVYLLPVSHVSVSYDGSGFL